MRMVADICVFQCATPARGSVLAKLTEDNPTSIWMCLDGWSAATTSYIGAEICELLIVDSLALDNNKNRNNNNSNNNNIKTTKDTDESPPTEWMSMSTQEIAQVDTQFPSDDPGWWQMWKRNEELEKEMIELMKN